MNELFFFWKMVTDFFVWLQILNIYIIVALVVIGLETHAYYLLLVAMFAFMLTAIFLVISLLESLTFLSSNYYWVESAYGLIAGLSFVVSSTVVLTTLKKEFFLTSVSIWQKLIDFDNYNFNFLGCGIFEYSCLLRRCTK